MGSLFLRRPLPQHIFPAAPPLIRNWVQTQTSLKETRRKLEVTFDFPNNKRYYPDVKAQSILATNSSRSLRSLRSLARGKTSILTPTNSQRFRRYEGGGCKRLIFLDTADTRYEIHSGLDGVAEADAATKELRTEPNPITTVDKTEFMKCLDTEAKYWYRFLQPERWGKTTFLCMLADYYDKSQAHTFEENFGQLYIGSHATRYRSTLLVLLFDFSYVQVTNGEVTESQFNSMMNEVLKRFLSRNAHFLGDPTINTGLFRVQLVE